MTSLSSPLLKINIRFISFSDSIKAFHSYRPGFDVHSSVERYFPNCCDVWRFEENQSLRQARLSSRLWGWRSKSGSDAAGQATLELLQPQNHLPSHPNHLLPTKNSGPKRESTLGIISFFLKVEMMNSLMIKMFLGDMSNGSDVKSRRL